MDLDRERAAALRLQPDSSLLLGRVSHHIRETVWDVLGVRGGRGSRRGGCVVDQVTETAQNQDGGNDRHDANHEGEGVDAHGRERMDRNRPAHPAQAGFWTWLSGATPAE